MFNVDLTNSEILHMPVHLGLKFKTVLSKKGFDLEANLSVTWLIIYLQEAAIMHGLFLLSPCNKMEIWSKPKLSNHLSTVK